MDPVDPTNLERVSDPQSIRGPALLKFLPFQTRLFDNVSVSGSDSELSGPFSDVVYGKEFECKRKAKELYGKDLYAAFSFSPKFKSAMESIKKERTIEDSDVIIIDSNVDETIKPDCDTEKKLNFNFLDFPDISSKEDYSEVEEKKKEKNGAMDGKKSGKTCLDDDEFFDTMSGYWRMLSVFDEFRISPPWYDAYGEGKEHWLQTKPVPKEVFENSRMKCLNWLQNYFNK